MTRIVFGVTALALAACASGGASWSASSWNGLDERNIETRNYIYAAAPMKDQGFKLKFSLKTDMFGVQNAGAPPPQAELEEAARQAAPEGCTLKSVEASPDGGGVADYDCPGGGNG